MRSIYEPAGSESYTHSHQHAAIMSYNMSIIRTIDHAAYNCDDPFSPVEHLNIGFTFSYLFSNYVQHHIMRNQAWK